MELGGLWGGGSGGGGGGHGDGGGGGRHLLVLSDGECVCVFDVPHSTRSTEVLRRVGWGGAGNADAWLDKNVPVDGMVGRGSVSVCECVKVALQRLP